MSAFEGAYLGLHLGGGASFPHFTVVQRLLNSFLGFGLNISPPGIFQFFLYIYL